MENGAEETDLLEKDSDNCSLRIGGLWPYVYSAGGTVSDAGPYFTAPRSGAGMPGCHSLAGGPPGGGLGKKKKFSWKRPAAICAAAALIYGTTYINFIYHILISTKLPVTTYLCILALCCVNTALMKTRLGQNMRTVGQNRTVANAAGINVDRTRILAMIFSTVLASWGQLIFLQNVGTFSTYGAHTQVGQFAIASLLVGGASVQKANNKQAILGVILFHTMFIVAPLAGKELFGNAMIGEYFRVFISYGIIAMALAMHAWKKIGKAVAAKQKQAAA